MNVLRLLASAPVSVLASRDGRKALGIVVRWAWRNRSVEVYRRWPRLWSVLARLRLLRRVWIYDSTKPIESGGWSSA